MTVKERRVRQARPAVLSWALGTAFAIGIYTAAPLWLSPSQRLPSGLAFLLAPWLLFRTRGRWNQGEVLALLAIFGGLFSMAFAQVLTGLKISELFDSNILLVLSISLGYLAYVSMRGWTADHLERVLLLSLLILVVGGALEALNIPPVRAVSDGFRQLAFEGRGMYSSDLRDIAQHGGIRPKFFTSEPSHLAKYIITLMTCWWIVTKRKHARTILWVILGVAVVAVRSPQFLLMPYFLTAVYFFHPRNPRSFFTFKRVMALICLLSLVPLSLLTLEAFQVGGRTGAILSGEDGSLILRFLGPLLLTGRSWQEFAFFGTGVGATTALDALLGDIFGRALSNQGIEGLRSLGSSFFSHWIGFGLVGGIFIAGLYGNLLRIMVRPNGFILALALVIGFSFQQGGYNGPRIWFFVFLAAATIRQATFPPSRVQTAGSVTRARKGRRSGRPSPDPTRVNTGRTPGDQGAGSEPR